MTSTLMILQAVVAVILIVLVLIQFGKGAETGLMSSVGDTTMSGATKGNILTKITQVEIQTSAFVGVGFVVNKRVHHPKLNVFDV